LIAASVGTWFWRNRRSPASAGDEDSRGTLIFDNTPRPSTPDGNLTL
jgi:hypothetical protein